MGESNMLRPLARLAMAVAVAWVIALPAQASDPIKMVPADALGLVVFDDLNTLDAKLAKAGESLQLPLPGPLTGLKAVPGLTECLDTDLPIVVTVLKGTEPAGVPALVGLLPVDDFDAFTKVFNGDAEGDIAQLTFPQQTVLAAEKDGYAVLVEEKDEAILKRVLESPGGMAEKLGDDLAWIGGRDVAALMTDAGVSVFCEKVLEGIEVAQEGIRSQGEDEMGIAQVLNVYKTMFAVLDQEVERVAVGLDVQESGDLVLRVRKRFLPAGRLAESIAVQDAPSDVLAGLPAGPFVIAGGCLFNAAMGDLMMEFSVEAMKAAPKLYGIGEEEADRMLELAKPLMSDMRSMAIMLAVGEPDDSIYSRMVASFKTVDAEKYMVTYRKYIEEFSSLVKGSEGVFSMAMETKSVEIDGRKGVEITMEFPVDWLQQAPNAEEMLEKMLGPGGKIRAFIVAADEHNVVIGYTQKTLLRKAIAALENGVPLAQDASVKQAAARLDDGNFSRGYFNPAGLIDFINGVIALMGPEEARGVQLPPFPDASLVAWSANAEGATVDAQLVVPGELVKAAVGYAALVRQTFESPTE
jgi:hypothetical protein